MGTAMTSGREGGAKIFLVQDAAGSDEREDKRRERPGPFMEYPYIRGTRSNPPPPCHPLLGQIVARWTTN